MIAREGKSPIEVARLFNEQKVGGPTTGRDRWRLERFAKMREDFPDRPRLGSPPRVLRHAVLKPSHPLVQAIQPGQAAIAAICGIGTPFCTPQSNGFRHYPTVTMEELQAGF